MSILFDGIQETEFHTDYGPFLSKIDEQHRDKVSAILHCTEYLIQLRTNAILHPQVHLLKEYILFKEYMDAFISVTNRNQNRMSPAVKKILDSGVDRMTSGAILCLKKMLYLQEQIMFIIGGGRI
ncbi:hypothetical protein KBD33_02635 [Candidatus Gracilibacteria bacterium]|nr:hypothetical protein [Candidatus Gracilibacteria bacterium]